MNRRELLAMLCGVVAGLPLVGRLWAGPVTYDANAWEVSYDFDMAPIELGDDGLWDSSIVPGELQIKSMRYRRIRETQWHEVSHP